MCYVKMRSEPRTGDEAKLSASKGKLTSIVRAQTYPFARGVDNDHGLMGHELAIRVRPVVHPG